MDRFYIYFNDHIYDIFFIKLSCASVKLVIIIFNLQKTWIKYCIIIDYYLKRYMNFV